MKTLVENSSKLSKFIFEDADVVTMEERRIVCPKFIIACHNQNDSTMYEGVTPPDDWAGNKYTFDGTSWTLNPDWKSPEEIQAEIDAQNAAMNPEPPAE